MIPTLQGFLEKKPLYYQEIDHTRVHSAYAYIRAELKHPRIVHIVGTNGKGSTGRMIAHLAHQSGLHVGHYTSPHIMCFNERIWVDGKNSSDAQLERGHRRLFGMLGEERAMGLSYFEYTTLLALVVCETCDLLVLEAGLGGEFDATNVCDKELSVITPIGMDHQAFLGESIEAIAATKIRSIQKQLLLSPQKSQKVIEVAEAIAYERGAILHRMNVRDEGTALQQVAEQNAWPHYLTQNAQVALEALKILKIPYQIEDLKCVALFGRFYPLRENIRIDVGHNPLAAQVIVEALEEKVVLIYNSLDDKDYKEVLTLLKPKVSRVEILPIHSQRATTREEIEAALQQVGIPYSYFNDILSKDESYLVFGSFYVVEEFLKRVDVSE